MMRRVFVASHVPAGAIEWLSSFKNIEIDYRDEDSPMSSTDLAERLNGCDGVLCTLMQKIGSDVLDNVDKEKLKVISTLSVGYDHIDLKTCFDNQIVIGNTPGVLTNTTAELALALMLATTRRIQEASIAVKEGEWGCWKPEWLLGQDIADSTVGIVGFGSIGKAVAKRLSSFECKNILVSHTRKPSDEDLQLSPDVKANYVEFETLLKESDIISLHCPLNDSTRHLFDSNAFSKMKKNSILINTSRGEVIDQDALYTALKEKQIQAAGLDVTTPEPLPTDHPLLTLPNCLVVPHIGSASERTRNKMAIIAAKNLYAGIEGKPLLHEVKPK